MLQVIDDIDDLARAGLQCCKNVIAELGVVPLAALGVVALGLALVLGADPAVISAAILVASLATVLRTRSPA